MRCSNCGTLLGVCSELDYIAYRYDEDDLTFTFNADAPNTCPVCRFVNPVLECLEPDEAERMRERGVALEVWPA
jgi:hypothetical protein